MRTATITASGVGCRATHASAGSKIEPSWSAQAPEIGLLVAHLLGDTAVRASHQPQKQYDDNAGSQVSH